eukprot:TRINITY_DN6347_c1_g2_i1.p1 TRINITY_DN6347_c1_g2~~TRINITY_DN6347_c1_g2_i1.p1  ORF type:complete len:1259 (-),score=215.95 TRINITY_DN6347_c1_g2_i1:253-3483(-)
MRKMRHKLKAMTDGGKPDVMDTIFQKTDRNGDGQLDSDEFAWFARKVLKINAGAIGDATLHNLFEVLDEDDSGTISIQELFGFVLGVQWQPEGGERTPAKESASISSSIASIPKKGARQRLDELHSAHKKKLDKVQAMREALAAEEMRKIEESKQRSKAQGSKRQPKNVGTASVGHRLYQDFFQSEARLREKQRYYAEQKYAAIEEARQRNLPTRSRSQSMLDSYEVGQRLYDDAERRERDRQNAKEEHELAELAKFMPPRRASVSSSTRHEDLYSEAVARKMRQEQKRRDVLEAERKSLEDQSVPSGNGRSYNAERVQELYNEHSERQRRQANAIVEKEEREMEQILKSKPSPSVPSTPCVNDRRHRPWAVNNDKDAVENELGGRRLASRGTNQALENGNKKPAKLASQANHSINSIMTIIKTRCGYASPETMWDKEHQSLAKSLNAAMKIYRDALKNCEASEGFMVLCSRASQRLCQEHLLPEFEGWNRCVEPDPIRQVEDRLEDLMQSAEKAQVVLKQAIAGDGWKQGTVRSHPSGVPIALFAHDPGVKSEASARAKAFVRYGPAEGNMRYRHITDLSRLLLVFSSCEMLMAGLDQIMRRFEVVDVRNYFANPGRLGVRCVEVLLIVHVASGREQIPHVCELRLEELCFHKAQEIGAPIMRKLFADFRRLYSRSGRDEDGIIHLVNMQLMKSPPPRGLRVFRSHLGKRFGSTVCAWRRVLGGGRLMGYQKFRAVCHQLKCGEHATEYWSGLDPTLAGKISLFDFDPEATALLIKLNARLLALADYGVGEQADAAAIFARMSFLVRPNRQGHLEYHEFRSVAKPMGLSQEEADKAFSYLDFHGGNHHAPPATITVQDIAWLLKLPQMIDIEAVQLTTNREQSSDQALRQLTWDRGTARYNKRGEILRWSTKPKEDGPAMLPSDASTVGRAEESQLRESDHGDLTPIRETAQPVAQPRLSLQRQVQAAEEVPSASERLSLQRAPASAPALTSHAASDQEVPQVAAAKTAAVATAAAPAAAPAAATPEKLSPMSESPKSEEAADDEAYGEEGEEEYEEGEEEEAEEEDELDDDQTF